MTEIHLPIAGTRSLRFGIAFLARDKRRGWRPILGIGLAVLFSLGLWALVLTGVWLLI